MLSDRSGLQDKSGCARRLVGLTCGALVVFATHAGVAEILDASTPVVRIRVGDNAVGSTNTVIYNAGVPAEMGGLPGVTAQPQAISTTNISGGSGVFEVRIVTDLNARNGASETEGRFSMNSSQPMVCITAVTCGTETISFTTISWNTRDNDTLNVVTQYDGTANQLLQIQRDTNPATRGNDNRHRNYNQYIFDNALLLPAGTYEGVISVDGEAVNL